MAQVKIFDQQKNEVGEMDLPADVFEVEVSAEILNLVVRARRAAQRAGTHATLNRAKMLGGGAKPWRQKGTGRARCGTNISPVWRGGAVVFGPQPRDYSFKVNKKVRKLAMKMALSSRLAEDNLMVVKGIDLPEIKTKHFVAIVEKLGLKKALIVTGNVDNNLALSARNIPGITVMTQDKLNVYDVLNHQQLVMFEDAANVVAERLK
ncbi:MAG: 50S ribosomal protein L4 [Desulfovibrionaceae bacterium]